jgi:hypothetical protein
MDSNPAADTRTDFTRLRRMGERGAHDLDAIAAILDAAPMCHVGHVVKGRPVVIPTLHWREGTSVYFHGSAASRMLETGAESEVCLTASIMDGWVLARSGFHHSINYRSAMVFGRPHAVSDPAEKERALTAFMEHFFPGRWAQLRPATAKELKSTMILGLPITEASAKIRTGMPKDDEADMGWPVWAGIVPLRCQAGEPEPDAGLDPALAPPPKPARFL